MIDREQGRNDLAERLLARMRDDVDHPWTRRLVARIRRAPLVPESILGPKVEWSPAGSPLTYRQLDVLRCLSYGLTLGMAADTLGLSYETVKVHSEKARDRLSAKNTAHAVALALRQGLIS